MKGPISRETALVCLLSSVPFINVFASRSPEELPPDFDVRQESAAASNQPAPQRIAAFGRLKSRAFDVEIGSSAIFRRPTFVTRQLGFLTGPGGVGEATLVTALAAVPAGDPHRAVKAFLNEYRGLCGHDSTVLNSTTAKRDYVTAHNGLRTTVWEQQLDGIPIFEAVLLAHISRRSELVNIENCLLADPAGAAQAGRSAVAKFSLVG